MNVKIMFTIMVIAAVSAFVLIIPNSAFAHQNGCHRWHSCPSDTGSYVCGDTGYCSQCPDNNYCKAGRPATLSYEPEPSKSVEKIPTTPQPGSTKPQSTIPSWVRTVFIWYADNKISESDLLKAIEFLIDNGIIKVKTG